MTRKRKERRKKIKKVEKYCRLRMVIWNFLSVLQRRDRPDRFSSTVTARRDIWLAATARASRQRTFATEVSTVPTAPTRVAGAVRRSLFVIAPYIYIYTRMYALYFIDIGVRNDPNGALPCDSKECRLPNCWCSEDGTVVPGNLTASTVPQMISITFDDAVNAENFELFSSRKLRY